MEKGSERKKWGQQARGSSTRQSQMEMNGLWRQSQMEMNGLWLMLHWE